MQPNFCAIKLFRQFFEITWNVFNYCNEELKLELPKYWVLSAAGADDTNANSNNIIFTIKDVKLYVLVVTLSVKDNKKLSKLLSREFERSVYWNKFKTKNENKNAANEFIYFLESNFVGVDRLFVLVYSNQDSNSRSFKTQRYYLPEGLT